MSAISLKSITGITSITTPAGVDNQLTLHTNNTTERVKITAEGNVHINNHLAVLGVSTHNDHVQIIDGKRLKVGSADNGDLILLHTGTDSIIDNATGNLFYRSATHKLQALNAEDMIVCNTDGAVELYHNNVKKLETKSTGVLISNQGSNRILDIHHTNGTSAYIAFLDQNTTDNSIVRCGAEANDFKIFAGGSERLRITSAGALKLTGQSTSFETAGLLHHTNNNLYIRGGTTGAILQSVDGNESWIVQNDYVSASTSGSERLRITSGGNVNIGGDYTQTTYTMKVTGSFAATTKSFVIDHPTKENHSLRYACLEGPENSVYVRGKTSESVIELPDYWKGLVHEDSITVNVTPIGNHKVWVEAINNNSVTIGSDGSEYFYTVFAERKDVDKLEVEVVD